MRRSDWQTRLAEFLADAEKKEFQWGAHDCALFGCNAILAMTDEDPAVAFRGNYDDMRSAYVALKRFAGGGLLETAEKICNSMSFPEVPVAFAQRGDVVVFEQEGNEILGVVDLSGRYVAAVSIAGGLLRFPLSTVLRAWRVE